MNIRRRPYVNVDGKYHILDCPVYEWSDGSKEWWVNGKRHRIGDPAYEGSSGYKTWWVNGHIHRIDGPACEYANGRKEWCINDREITKINDFLNLFGIFYE